MRRQHSWKRSSHVPSVTISIKARPTQDANLWINGGFFIFRSQIFEYLGDARNWIAPKGYSFRKSGGALGVIQSMAPFTTDA
jgi:hypothetical protein